MPTASKTKTAWDRYQLRESAYDRVSSLVIALLVLFTLVVAILFVLWLTSTLFPTKTAVPVMTEPIGEGGGLGDHMELDPNVTEPGIETEFEQPELETTLETITDALAVKSVVMLDQQRDQEETGIGGPKGKGSAPGQGRGRPGKPRHWEVQFLEGSTLDMYASQLDYFGIELGVLMPNNRVQYASNLSRPTPDVRTGPADEDNRYYLTWVQGELEEADRRLLEKAGIEHEGKIILKFLEPELEAQLAQLEKAHAGSKADKVRATFFAIHREDTGYEFQVANQLYRP